MFSKTHELMIGGIFALRSWCKEHLPIENSLIAYDLILVLAINNYAKNDISIKELFASVPHSYTAVRGHYLRFVKDGWVEHYLDSSDRRIKYVRPTPKLVKTMNDYANTANKIMLKSIDWSFYREGGGHRLPLTHPPTSQSCSRPSHWWSSGIGMELVGMSHWCWSIGFSQADEKRLS